MPTKEEIDAMLIILWNMRIELLRACECGLTSSKERRKWKEEANAINLAWDYIKFLETRIKDLEQIEAEHQKINADLMKKLSMEAMLKDLKRSKLYERSTNE